MTADSGILVFQTSYRIANQGCPKQLKIVFMDVWPNTLGICGAVLVMVCVAGIALEEKYLSNASSSEHDYGTDSDTESAPA